MIVLFLRCATVMPGEKRKAADSADISKFFKRQTISVRSETDVSESDKTASPKSQRQSGIDVKWKKDFPWLQESSDGMKHNAKCSLVEYTWFKVHIKLHYNVHN